MYKYKFTQIQQSQTIHPTHSISLPPLPHPPIHNKTAEEWEWEWVKGQWVEGERGKGIGERGKGRVREKMGEVDVEFAELIREDGLEVGMRLWQRWDKGDE